MRASISSTRSDRSGARPFGGGPLGPLFGLLFTLWAGPLFAETPAPGYGTPAFTPPPPGSYRLPPIKPAADGPVTLEQGEPSTLGALFDGRLVVLSFIYSSCNDVNGCPLALHVLSQLRQRLKQHPELARQVRIISFSFDPAHDTPEVLQGLAESFTDGTVDWRFATAPEASLPEILDAYGQFIARDADGISHGLRVYLIDRERRIRNIYSSAWLHADLLTNDLLTLAGEESPKDPRESLRDHATGAGDDKRGYERPDYRTRSLSLPGRTGQEADLLAVLAKPPLGLPPVPGAEAITGEKVQLGRKLFFDRRLSHNGTLSCAMCHIPEQGFTSNELATSVGIEGLTVRRNAPTLYNVAYLETLFHDGRENRLEQQAWQPMLAANEMGNPSIGHVIGAIERLADYEGLFEAAFDGRGPTMETVGEALASYQKLLISGNSPFDRWRYGGDQTALSEPAKHGFLLFAGTAGCISCHVIDNEHALFTDQRFHDTGLGWHKAMQPKPERRPLRIAPGVEIEIERRVIDAVGERPPNDLGRYEVTLDPADRWAYRTPTLRNIALTSPYMHDGSLPTLEAVVDYYNRGGHRHPGIDPRVRPLNLSAEEKRDLVAFLEALTGDNVTTLVRDAFAAPVGDPSANE